MSFVDGFYTFSFELSHIDRNIFESLRVRTAKHPEESILDLAARALAFSHGYCEGIQFSQGLYDPKQPAIFAKNSIDEIYCWIDIECSDIKKLNTAFKSYPDGNLSVYFKSSEEIASFCHALRGSKQNWVKDIDFYLIDPDLLQTLQELIAIRNNWSCTYVDNIAYLEIADITYQGSIQAVDIWNKYQLSIGNQVTAS